MSVRIRGIAGAVFPLALLLGLAAAVRAQNTNLTWTGGGGDNLWTNIANWNGATYPNNGQPMATSKYNATVNSGTPTLNTDITIENFTLGGGTVSGAGNLTLNALFTVSGGTMTGTGTTTLIFGSELLSGYLNRTIVSTAGAVNNLGQTGAPAGSIGSSTTAALWNNQLSSTFNILNDSGLSTFNFVAGTFNNSGTFQKTGGTGISTIAWNFNNLATTGAVNVQSGTLNFTGGGTDTGGTYFVSSGAVLEFQGTRTLNSAVSGAGTVTFGSGANVTVSGAANAFAPSGDTTVNSGTVAFSSATSLNTMHLVAGVVDGSAALTINGLLTWSAGQMGPSSSPGAGTTTLTGGASLTNTLFMNRTVNNASGSTVATTNNTTTLYCFTSNAVWNNQAGSVFNLAGDASVLANNANLGFGTFNNAGTFQKTAGTTSSTVQWFFNNTGAVNAQAGTLYFGNNGTDTGAYTVSSGAVLGFTGGTRGLNGSVTGAGNFGFFGANVTVGGAANAFAISGDTNVIAATAAFNSAASTNTLHLSGTGTIDGTAALTVNGLFTWTGGNMGATTSPGAGTTTLNGGASISGPPSLNRTIFNSSGSTATFSGSGNLTASSTNAIWTNQAGATFTLAGDNTIANLNGTFANAGTFQKTGGTGTSSVQWIFNNTGTINATTGTIYFQGSGHQNGAITIGTGATVNFSGVTSGTTTTWSGASSSGAGTLLISGGTSLFNGTNTLNSVVSLTGGAIDGTGSLTINGPFSWSGGNMQGAGTTTLNGGGTFTAAFNLSRTVTNAAGSTVVANQSGTGGMYSQSANANWINAAGSTYNFVNDANLFVGGGTGTFTNSGLFEKTGGTGTCNVNWNFSNSGTINATSGTTNFATNGANTQGGSITVGTGATVQFSAATSTWNGGSSSGAGTVSLTSGTNVFNGTDALASRVSLSAGAIIDGAGGLTISGPFAWSGGYMGARSSPGAGTTTISGGATLTGTLFQDRTVTNASGSTVTFANAGIVYCDLATAVWNNQAGATFTLAADASFLPFNTTFGTINNSGTFQKTAGTTYSPINWFFNNSGAVSIQAGTLYFGNNGTDTGSYSVSSGAILGFTAGTRTLNAGITGAGTVGFFGANVTVGGAANAYAVTGDTSVTAGSVTFNSAASTNTLHMSGGTIDGMAALTVNGLFTWSGGNMGAASSPGAGTTTLNGGATLSSNSNLNLNRAIVNASGSTVTFSGSGNLTASSANATWTNQAGATFSLVADVSLTNSSGVGTFTNAGTFQKTAGTGTSQVIWTFNNTGTVNVTAATLLFNGTTLSNVSGTTLTGGTWHVVGPTSGTTTLSFGSHDVQTLGNGTTVILENANSVFNVNNSMAIDNRLTTLAAGSELEVLNGRSYSVVNPSNTFTNNGILLVGSNAGASTFTVGAGINLTNYNAGTQTLAGGNWQVQGNATLTLGSRTITTIAAGTNVGLTFVGSTAASFPALTANLTTNNGTLQLLGGQSLTTAGSLTNTGTIQITGGGTLTVAGAFTNTGTVQTGGGAVNVNGTTTVQSGATLIVGAGTTFGGAGTMVVNNGGTLTVQGTVNQPTTVGGVLNGNATLGSSLVIQAGGFIRPGNSPGTVTVNGALTLGGEYDWDLNGNDTTQAGTTFDQVTVAGAATLSPNQSLKVVLGTAVNFGNSFWSQSQTWPAIIANGGFTSQAVPAIAFDATTFQGVFPGGSFALAEQSTALNVVWTPGFVRQSTFAATGDGHWNNPTNWNAPPLSGPGAQLVFGPTAQPATMMNDIPGTFVLNAMTFTAGAPAYILTGNGVEFRTNAAGMSPQMVSNSSNPVTIGVPLTLTNGLTVGGSGDIALTAAVGGAGGLTMTGAGTLTLAAANTYAGGTNIISGTIAVAADAALGAGDVAGSSPGALTFSNTTTTSRSFVMNGGTISVVAGKTVTFNGGAIGGANFDGGGTFVANGARFVGITIAPSVAVTSTSPTDQFVHAVNSGAVGVAAGVNAAGTGSTINFNGFTNQGIGSLTIGATSQVNVASFQSYGTMTVNPATVTETFSQTTLVTNLGTAPLGLNGGSRTNLGTPQTAVFPPNWPDPSLRGLPTFVAGIDLHGQNAIVASGLFVNNGYVEDSTNNFQGPGTIVADFGALVKGAGYFQNTVQTINGGKFQAGNSPGKATFGTFVLGPSGVSSYIFAIDDATGAAGPSPDAAGHVSGWGLVQVGAPPVTHGGLNTQGDFVWMATPADRLTVALETLVNPTTVGTDVPGPMDHFDPSRPFSWPAVEWSGSYAGPADVAFLDAATTFDTSGFANPVAGTFGWSLDAGGHTLSLTYTPSAVPEPGTLALTGFAIAALRLRRRRSRPAAAAAARASVPGSGTP